MKSTGLTPIKSKTEKETGQKSDAVVIKVHYVHVAHRMFGFEINYEGYVKTFRLVNSHKFTIYMKFC